MFFEKCIEAEIAESHERAVIYANECAEVRKLARLVISSELALEQAALRLQTINKLGDVMVTMSPIVEIVEETRGRLAGIIPSVSSSLDEVNSMLKSSLLEMGTVGVREGNKDSSEAMKVLREANLTAEEKIREKFPRLPEDLGIPEETAESRVPIALTASGGSLEDEGRNLLEQRIYEYVKARNGELDPVQCASFLGVPPKDVEEIMLKLKEGRIGID